MTMLAILRSSYWLSVLAEAAACRVRDDGLEVLREWS